MAKSPAELLKKRKAARQARKEANKGLKTSKNWYPVTDGKRHFTRKSKTPRAARLRKDIQAGQVLILLSGRFRGRRVVFLKALPSDLLLVTGPYKVNGVPLKRVNQAYVIATKTRVNLGNLPGLDKVTDEFFRDHKEKEANVPLEDPKRTSKRLTNERREAQNNVDTEVVKAVRAIPQLREYLSNRFALKNGDKPHLMNF
jgi:large subunit ribosomal protein L6e